MLEYYDTIIPSHLFANIGNDTARWHDGWFSDTVYARRLVADIFEVGEALIISRMTTTERDALTPVNGMIVYDTTLTAFYFYEDGSWVTK